MAERQKRRDMDSLTQSLLEDTVRRESRSLLQYVRDAFPWTSAEERAALAEIERMIDEELRGAALLMRLLQRAHVPPPYIGPYPMEFTNINYLSLDHLMPQLVARQRQAIADLERDVLSMLDEEARTLVNKVLDKKRQHLAALEKTTARQPEAVKV